MGIRATPAVAKEAEEGPQILSGPRFFRLGAECSGSQIGEDVSPLSCGEAQDRSVGVFRVAHVDECAVVSDFHA